MITRTSIKYPEITVQLSGTDGNAFNIIGRVRKAINREHGSDAAAEYSREAMDSGSYDELLQHAIRTVNVY